MARLLVLRGYKLTGDTMPGFFLNERNQAEKLRYIPS
jgi:hypothetical protein